MSGGLFSVVFVLFLVAAVVIGLLAWLSAKRRREAMAAYAASRGWTYTERDHSLVDRFDGAPFGTGHSRRATNVLRGEHDGRPVVAFDYQYSQTTGTGEDRRTETHHFSVVVTHIGAVVPSLSVRPQNVLTGFLGRLTNTDIELESEDFNRAFVVGCPDRKFAFDVLHPRMMEMLLAQPDFAWRFSGDSMLVVRDGSLEPPEIEALLDRQDRVLDAIPEFVWREVRGA